MVDLGQAEGDLGIARSDWQQPEGKADNVARHQDWRTAVNALVLCYFANVPPQTTRDLVNAATGFDYTLDDLLRLGKRAWNLKRAINHRLGLIQPLYGPGSTPDEPDPAPYGQGSVLPPYGQGSVLPLQQPYAEGGAAGYVPDMDGLLSDYYRARGWDEATGKPTHATLFRLGLSDVADDLWGRAA